MRLRARHYRTGNTVDVITEAGRITAIEPVGLAPADHEGGWISPALFDLQINGCHGQSFSSPDLTVEHVDHIVRVCRSHEIAGLCPTLVTNEHLALIHGFTTLARACDSDWAINESAPCFHLEGPYISAEDGPRGAHPRAHVRPPSWDEFCAYQDAARGRIRLVTLSPEYEQGLAFIERLVSTGVVVAIGHTSSSCDRIREGVSAGAVLSTHLGNGAHAVLPRHPNYLWEQLADDRLCASVIADGHHLPASVVKCIVRVKTPARCIITCDASGLAGLPPGRYAQWGTVLEVLAGGKVVVPGTPFLAGSGVFTDACVAGMIRMAETSLADAIDMASLRPRALLRLPTWDLEAGRACRLMIFDWQPGGDIQVRQVL